MYSRCAPGSQPVTNGFVLGGNEFKFLFLFFLPSFLLLLPVKAASGRRCRAFFLEAVNATTLLERPPVPRLWPRCVGVMGAPRQRWSPWDPAATRHTWG